MKEMPQVLLKGVHAHQMHHEVPPAPTAVSGMKHILMLLRSATGHDFSLYKKSTIGRRIERRMSQHNIEDMEIYARYLKENPSEVQLLFKELLINVTSFFRDPEAFAKLKEDIFPQLLAGKPEDYVFRVWVAGCATGEEAYSIAMLLREYMDEAHQEVQDSDLQHRPRRRCHCRGACRHLSAEYRPGPPSGALAPLLHQGG